MQVTANTVVTTVVKDVTITLSPGEARTLINFLIAKDDGDAQYALRVALLDALDAPMREQLREALNNDPVAREDAVNGRKVHAIKAIRSVVPSAGLKQAKDVVDEYAIRKQNDDALAALREKLTSD